MEKQLGIGFVGCGNISRTYLPNVTKMFPNLRLVGVCDLIPERSKEASEKYGCKCYKDMYELFADPEVDMVLNITRPAQHYAVSKAALLAGKNVWSEKPLSPNFEEAKELTEIAKAKGLTLGGAPDTFLGAGIQTARALIDAGEIGDVIGGAARFVSHGMEMWHPDPEFFYVYGGGPVFDMCPYYVTALVNLIGRVDAVTSFTKRSFDTRTITSQPKAGKVIPVEVQTYVSGVLRFENGAVCSVLATWDIYSKGGTHIEIYGTKGTIIVPDPNCFGGEVKLLRAGAQDYEVIPLRSHYTANCRALGMSEAFEAMQEGRMHRANYMQQLHVVEVMNALNNSNGTEIKITTPFERQPLFVEE